VDALASSGKTYAAAKIFAESAERGRKVLFVQPTKKLIAETVDHTFKVQGVDPTMVTEFSERTCPNGGIVKAIIDHMSKSAPGRGEIVVITHAAFLLLAQVFTGGQVGTKVFGMLLRNAGNFVVRAHPRAVRFTSGPGGADAR
jgi:superfamily II DNA or RNA helicase